MKLTKLLRLSTGLLLFFSLGLSGYAATYQYSFVYKRKNHTLRLNLPNSIVDHYRNKTHYWPTALSAYGTYSREDAGHTYLRSVANQIRSQASDYGYEDWELIAFTVAFVQSLPYLPEEEEYVRYPIETLSKKGGDCEDTAILMAALLVEYGYDAQLIHVPGHMMVGLACSDCEGDKVKAEGREYILIETTGTFPIGDIDKRYAHSGATLIEPRRDEVQSDPLLAVNRPKPANPGPELRPQVPDEDLQKILGGDADQFSSSSYTYESWENGQKVTTTVTTYYYRRSNQRIR